MSGITIAKNTELNCLKSYSIVLTLFIIVLKNITTVSNAQETELRKVIEIYKCNGSKLSGGYDILVPSYVFNSSVTLRIKDDKPFPGCELSGGNPQELTELYFKGHEPELNESEIESFLTSINPKGVLNVRNQFYEPDEYCVLNYTKADNVTKVPSLQLQYCPQNCSDSKEEGSRLCIRKCCPPGKAVDFQEGRGLSCEISGNNSWSAFFYDETSWKPVSINSKHPEKIIKKPHYFKERMSEICNGSNYEVWVMRKLTNHALASTRLLTNGQLIYISAHRSWSLLDSVKNKFCIDGIQNVGGPDSRPYYSGDERDQVIFICFEDIGDKPRDKLSTLYMYSLFVASVFYLAPAIVYVILWDKQNTHGWTVFSLVLSQFLMCLFVGNAHRMGIYGGPEIRNSNSCITNAILAHFFLLASFTWLAVINFDLWSTFRSLKPRNHNKVDLKKFSLYSIVGWGIPLIVVTIGVILDHSFPERESLVLVPEYGTNLCYVATWAQGPYVYYIMAFLLVITVTLSILTCGKIYQFHKDTAGARSSSNAGDRKMFSLYAKLSVVLGISWIFEFISWAASSEDHQHWIWTIFDMYNLLTAVFIFIIFVCKRTILTQLTEKYSCMSCLKPINNVMTKWMRGKSSDGTASSVVVTQRSGNQQQMEMYGRDNKDFQNSTSDVHSKQ